MRIGIDCHLFNSPTGIGRYTYHLVHALSKLTPLNHQVILASRQDNPLIGSPEGFSLAQVSSNSRVIWANLYAPQFMRRERVDLYHAVDNLSLPAFWPKGMTRYVLTVHDLIPLLLPQTVKPKHRWYFRLAIGRLLRIADGVIADSYHTKQLILDRFVIHKDKITVVHIGVDLKTFKPVEDLIRVSSVLRHYGLQEEPYLLFVGNIEPKKNLPTLIQAFAKLIKSGLMPKTPKLLIAGPKAWHSTDVMALPVNLGLEDQVRFLGKVADADLPALYTGASAFVFPSLYEGFGLPPLEAMACGTPVVTSNTSSLPEVVGDAAIMVDPHDVEGLADAMHRVLTDKELREEMRRKGLERAKLFSWEETARRTLKVYEEVFAQGKVK